jgi:hypothetical protein
VMCRARRIGIEEEIAYIRARKENARPQSFQSAIAIDKVLPESLLPNFDLVKEGDRAKPEDAHEEEQPPESCPQQNSRRATLFLSRLFQCRSGGTHTGVSLFRILTNFSSENPDERQNRISSASRFATPRTAFGRSSAMLGGIICTP